MKKSFVHVLFFTLLLMFSTSVFAQKTEKKTTDKSTSKMYKVDTKKYLKDWLLVAHFGTTTPFTDIRSYDWVRQTKKPSELQWACGAGLTKMFTSAFGLNIDYTLGKILGRTVDRGGFAEERQYWKVLGFDQPVYFKTTLFHQASVNFYIDWLGIGNNYNKYIRSQITKKPIKNRIFTFYSKIGVGFIRTSSQLYNVKDDKPITNSQYLRGYTNKFTETIFPITNGFKFKVSKSFDIGLEGVFVFLNSDKLDAFNYDGSDGKLSLSKINRDAYAYINVNVAYKFGRIGSQKEHIEWVNPLAFIAAMQPPPPPAPKPVDLKDTDGDGVLDILDQEPNTKKGCPVDTKGVALDSDKDGCPDCDDPEPYSTPQLPIENCKNVKTILTEEVKRTVTDSITVVGKVTDTLKVETDNWQLISIYYDLNKYNITPTAATELKKVAATMKKKPDFIVEVQGHTDSRGSVEYNQKSSENRVNAAINYLKKNFGIPESRFKRLPLGKMDPTIKDAATENQHQINRRVDFKQAK